MPLTEAPQVWRASELPPSSSRRRVSSRGRNFSRSFLPSCNPGLNTNGQLGYGDQRARGGGLGEMGEALEDVDLGEGQRAISVDCGWYHTCALLTSGNVKCWGEGGCFCIDTVPWSTVCGPGSHDRPPGLGRCEHDGTRCEHGLVVSFILDGGTHAMPCHARIQRKKAQRNPPSSKRAPCQHRRTEE